MRHWAAELIGTPYTHERNCWWLVRHACKVMHGIDMPQIDVGASDNMQAIRQATEGWHKVSSVADGDVILMRSVTKLHCGIVLKSSGRLGVLHSVDKIGVCFESVEDATRGMSVEIWRRN